MLLLDVAPGARSGWSGSSRDVIRAFRPPGIMWSGRLLAHHFEAQLDGPDWACPSVAVWRALWRMAVRPGWSGHGDRYQWQADEPFLEEADVARLGRATSGPVFHAGKVALAVRYLAPLALPRGLP